MKNILVTGGSGKAGRATIKLLLEKNYNVFNVDFVNNPELDVPFTKVDFCLLYTSPSPTRPY